MASDSLLKNAAAQSGGGLFAAVCLKLFQLAPLTNSYQNARSN